MLVPGKFLVGGQIFPVLHLDVALSEVLNSPGECSRAIENLTDGGMGLSPSPDILEQTIEGYYFRCGRDEWLHRSEPMFEECDFCGRNSEKEKGLKVFHKPAQNIALDVVCAKHWLITDTRVRWIV